MQQQNFEWDQPTGIDLKVYRQEYRNMYGYTNEFIKENDLFGENKYMPKEELKTDIQVNNKGQLNLVTTGKKKGAPPVEEDKINKKDSEVYGNFTPIMAHRYL